MRLLGGALKNAKLNFLLSRAGIREESAHESLDAKVGGEIRDR